MGHGGGGGLRGVRGAAADGAERAMWRVPVPMTAPPLEHREFIHEAEGRFYIAERRAL